MWNPTPVILPVLEIVGRARELVRVQGAVARRELTSSIRSRGGYESQRADLTARLRWQAGRSGPVLEGGRRFARSVLGVII